LDEIAAFLRVHEKRGRKRGLEPSHFGDRIALSRLLSMAARGEEIEANARELGNTRPTRSRPRVIAVTGSGGVGKSTLIGKLIEVARSAGRAVAVLACDPQSSLTGGALLGDRIRMPSGIADEGVFIRSLATPSGHSGVAPHVDRLIGLFGRFGFNTVIV